MTDADRQYNGQMLEALWRQTSALVDAVMKEPQEEWRRRQALHLFNRDNFRSTGTLEDD